MRNTFKYQSLAEHIVRDLEEKIIIGTLEPGQRIIEESLCKKLGVSRSPVREALRILESQGFVRREPRKGVSVTWITQKEAENIYRIRANLESLATYLAVKEQDPEVLRKLKKIHSKMKELAEKENITAYFRLNLKFHETLVNASNNQRLIQMIETFVKQTKRYRVEVLTAPGRLKASIENHEAIIRSFEAGDAEQAEYLRKSTILRNIHIFSEKFKEKKGGEE